MNSQAVPMTTGAKGLALPGGARRILALKPDTGIPHATHRLGFP